MKSLATIILSLTLLTSAGAHAQSMVVEKSDTIAARRGSAETFTGEASIKPLFSAEQHSGTSAGHVSFVAGARSAWHSHPAGQTLIVTSGVGWVQEEGGRKYEIKPGDVIRTPAGVKHWHGATSTSPMSHIAITETVNGRNADWMEQVTNEQYLE